MDTSPSVGICTRRSLLTAVAGATLLGCAGGAGRRSAGPGGGPRRKLGAAAPMLPPVPAILLTVKGAAGPGSDEISVVWTFVCNGKPPQIGISVADEHVAQALVDRHREFVLNVPTVGIVEAFDRVDMKSTETVDKFALAGLTRGRAVAVDAPTVAEAPIQVECRVSQRVVLPPGRVVFFADVVATTVTAGVCDATGMLLVENVPFFGMTAGSGEFYTMGECVGHIGRTKGVERGRYRY